MKSQISPKQTTSSIQNPPDLTGLGLHTRIYWPVETHLQPLFVFNKIPFVLQSLGNGATEEELQESEGRWGPGSTVHMSWGRNPARLWVSVLELQGAEVELNLGKTLIKGVKLKDHKSCPTAVPLLLWSFFKKKRFYVLQTCQKATKVFTAAGQSIINRVLHL